MTGGERALNTAGPTRVESDFLGSVTLPKDALHGIESERAKNNFPLGYKKTNLKLIRAIILVKKAAALSWKTLLPDEAHKFDAIALAADNLLNSSDEDLEAGGFFIVDALAGGAGTSVNMNVNEVLANSALVLLGKAAGDYEALHPLDDVNRGQSTNDVYPTALRIAAILELRALSASCAALQEALQKKENDFDDVQKLGRTELMDAVPVSLGSEFGAWAQAISRDRWRLYKAEERLRQVNIGGAAVGFLSSSTAERALHHRYEAAVIEKLRELCGLGLARAEYPMDITQNNDVFVEVSGLLKALSVNLSKIAGDLRLMNSGPDGGIGELSLAPLQKGSTIMPAKVNPVIPEMVIQAAIRVRADDLAISEAASRGEFELNAFLPLIADSFLEQLALLRAACDILREKCIDLLSAKRKRCETLLLSSFSFASAFIPALGYDAVAALVATMRKEGADAAAVQAALQKLTKGQN